MWYGLSRNKKLGNNFLKYKRGMVNKKTARYGWARGIKLQFNKIQLRFNIPSKWSFIMCKNNTKNSNILYLYSQEYYFMLPIPAKFDLVQFDKNASTIVMSSIYVNNYTLTYWTFFNQMFLSFNRPYFLKIKFKGKGYYIYKNKRNTITPQFGYAHRIYKYTFFTSIKFRTKTSIIIFGLLKNDLITSGLLIKNMRSINIFTGRGVRFSRQIIYKKVGKVSSYR